jgi:outer membrane protein
VQAKELVKSTQENINNTKTQLEKAQRQFDAGAINEGALFNLKAQLANDEVNLVNAQNQEITASTNLKMLLRIPVEDNFEITVPATGNFEALEYSETVQTLYDSALAKRHDIQASEYRVESAVYRKKASFGSFLPTLTLGANLNTVYSSSAKEISSYILKDYAIGKVQTTNEIVISQQPVYTLATTSFSKQLKNNFGQSLGITMSVPIFNKLQAENNYQLAKIDLERSKLNAEKTRQNLYNEIVSVYNAFESAQKRFKAAKLNHDAQQLNLDFIVKRYDGGQSSATELQIAKSTEMASRVNEVSVKYEYIFRRMVLDYYAGKKLELY